MGRPSLNRRVLFHVERLLTRGLFYKLLFVWFLIVAIAFTAGLIAELLPADHFDTLRDAVWWAFLRLSDPGYLAEEDAPGLRVVSVVLTVLGLAVFVGALVAIITQWLNAKMERLSLGMTPITISDHYVILGWTSRTLELLVSIVKSKAGGSPRIAILVDRVTPELVQQIRDRLGKSYDDRRIILRSGNPHQVENLQRVNCVEARKIILRGASSHWLA